MYSQTPIQSPPSFISESAQTPPQARKSSMLPLLMRLLYIVFVLLVGTGGYYVGSLHNTNKAQALQNTIFTPTPTISSMPTLTPTPTPHIVSAGGLSSFSPYSLTVPGEWKVSRERQEALQADKTTLTKGAYQLAIIEGPLDGGACGYSDAPLDSMGETYGNFVTIHGNQGRIYRRAMQDSSVPLPKGTNQYDVCEFEKSYQMFMQLTTFGVITYTTPVHPDSSTLQEMDALIASLKTQ